MNERAPGPDEDPDDGDALHWAGDEARGQEAPRLRGAASEALAADAPDPGAEQDVVRRAPGEIALRAGTGAFAVLYLALAVGWILSVQLLGYPGLDLVGEIGWQFGEFLAMVAAVLWFVAVLSLTPAGTRRRGPTRFAGLAVGVLLLLPWPILLRNLG